MPILSKEQLIEIELEMQELLDEVEELRRENEAIKARLTELMTDRSMSV